MTSSLRIMIFALSCFLTCLPSLVFADSTQRTLAQVVAATKPAVVFIVVQTATGAQSGSGFVLKSDATTTTVVTANHVIEGGNQVDVIFDSDEHERYQAKIIKHDHVKDVAILQVPLGNRPALALATSSSVEEGESIVLIGYPVATLEFRRIEGDNLRPSIHSGIVSAIRFNGEIIQFDAATFHGDSGAPIVDVTTGAVVAIVHGSLLDQHYSSVGLEQSLPGSTYGPSTTTIASVVGDIASTPSAAVGNDTADVAKSTASPKLTEASAATRANSASFRVGYGVPHDVTTSGSAEFANSIGNSIESSALDRLTTFLKSDNSLYLVPVNIDISSVSDPQRLAGYCDDNRLNAIVFPSYMWRLTGGPRYNIYGRQEGYNGNAEVGMGFYAFDCYGQPFFIERKEKSEGRRFAHRTPDREIVDMANDLLDHLMQDFATARKARQAAWTSLLKTGLAFDPADEGLHSMFYIDKKPEGFQVTVVVPDGPADHAGVKPLDIINRINNIDASTLTHEDLLKVMRSAPSYTLDIQRPGGSVTVTVHPQSYQELVKTFQH